ncbi:LacI family DNA-binding transcriptional regulator [bacterium]|nr:LacI family DNA-binding transcriptional regulator [bacterium]
MSTIKEIAKKANVSIGTVDRVLHGRGRVAPETAEKIQKIIREMGYKPNLFARNLKLSRLFHFGILMPQEKQDGGYWAQSADGMRKALDELKSNQVRGHFYYYDKYSHNSFDHMIRAITNARLDGLIIAPILANPINELLQNLSNECPYLFFDSDLPETSPLSVINQDAHQSGRLAAELMIKLVPSSGSFLVIKVIPDDYHINARVKGFVDFLTQIDCHNVHVLDANIGDDPHCILPMVDQFMNHYPGLHGIFMTNALTYQVAEVIHQLSIHPKPSLIGYDLIDANAYWLERGIIDFIISQRPEMQGYQGIYTLFRHLVTKEPVEKRIVLPLDIITRENMLYHRQYVKIKINQ